MEDELIDNDETLYWAYNSANHDMTNHDMQRSQLHFYLDHCKHSFIRDGIGADYEVSGGVSADDAIDRVPVRAVGLIPVHHCEVGDNHVHLVFRHLPGKLHKSQR
ncbi:hypothetical protein ATANTOWER_002811 [Ataeniobius toweri]|uniref:Uncharacterized protein n=1 Tax=Ataeniobius toweri TaxID=208326 RepID=A0ABU7CBW4_9TELE|nr:hypothetical protein [Ataeniobius toweri]